MTAFFVATVNVKDPQKFQQYAEQAAATFQVHGGQPVLRGVTADSQADHQAVGIVSFPAMESLVAWYNSPEYQVIVPLRNEAADMTITAYSVPE